MSFLLDLLRTPSAYRYDATGYLRNQMLHAYLVGGGLTFALQWLLGLVSAPPVLALIIIFVGYAAWEAVQWQFFRAEIDDALEDLAHVMSLALAVHFAEPALAFPQLLFVLSGYAYRLRFRAPHVED